jgi:hypothetical protein
MRLRVIHPSRRVGTCGQVSPARAALLETTIRDALSWTVWSVLRTGMQRAIPLETAKIRSTERIPRNGSA